MAETFGLRGTALGRAREFQQLRTTLSAEAQSSLDELQRLYRVKLEMDSHYGLQQLLRGWLWLHVPTAVVLVRLNPRSTRQSTVATSNRCRVAMLRAC